MNWTWIRETEDTGSKMKLMGVASIVHDPASGQGLWKKHLLSYSKIFESGFLKLMVM